MPHARQQIRDFVAAGLGALATTGGNIFIGRTRPLGLNHPPALLIYTRAETSVRAVMGRPPGQERPVMLHIEGRVATAAPPDDLLDTIAAEVEVGVAALIDYNAGIFFGGLAQNVDLISTDAFAKAEGEKHIGSIVLQYRVTYRVAEGNPLTIV
jgi:hypothetical protein